jgi:MaoC like domain
MTTETQREPFVGQRFSRKWTLTAKALGSYRGGLAVEPGGCPPQMLANAAEPTFLFSQQRGHLWLRHEWEFHQPLVEGVEYVVDAEIVDIYARRDRTILLWETNLRDPDGRLVSRQRHHQSFLLDNAPIGEVQLRDPAAKEGGSRSRPVLTKELASLERTVTLEMCGEFFYGSKSYHSDREQSAALGFRDVVVGGRMTMGYVGELLDREFGERWARSGRLLVKFTNVLWPMERIRVSAGLGGPLEDDPARDVVLARVEKPDGVDVLVAEGSIERGE